MKSYFFKNGPILEDYCSHKLIKSVRVQIGRPKFNQQRIQFGRLFLAKVGRWHRADRRRAGGGAFTVPAELRFDPG